MTSTPHVYTAINSVQTKLSKDGISKDRRNQQGSGYNFRGIDDVYNVLSSILSECGLVILPRVTERHQDERTSKSGGSLFYTTIKMEFDLVSAVDGSKHTIATYGEAMDSGDKSTNKAMSAAYKYAAFQAFCIPVEGDNDADASTHQVVVKDMANKADIETINVFATGADTGPVVAKAFTHYKVKTAKELTAEQAAVIIKRCIETVQK
jgi:hypothetical protein